MTSKRLSFIPKIILPFAVILFLSGCSQQFHCKKCTSSGVIQDTLTVAKDVITERVKTDTVLIGFEMRAPADTVIIRKDNLVIRYKKLAGDTIYLGGECLPDTLKVEIRVPVETKVETGLAWWKVIASIIAALLLGAVIARIAGRFL